MPYKYKYITVQIHYRLALTSVFPKVVEKLIYELLNNFFSKYFFFVIHNF